MDRKLKEVFSEAAHLSEQDRLDQITGLVSVLRNTYAEAFYNTFCLSAHFLL